MAFTDFPEEQDAIELLQRSLERGRLGHAYLFHGADLGELEAVARTLAKTLNCAQPRRRGATGQPVDCCDACLSCRKINGDTHPDVMWVRPESKLRVITIDQMVTRKESLRPLLPAMHLKPTEARYKAGIIVSADRLNANAANAFLKTLEEPPADSILILLTTEPQRLLETIVSRCLRLNFGGEAVSRRDPALLAWLGRFTAMAAEEPRSLLGRYHLLSLVLGKLGEIKAATEETMAKRSPLEVHDDVEPGLKEKWESELAAATESEYRRQRTELLALLHWWLRDVWLETLRLGRELFTFPERAEDAARVAGRLSPRRAMENLDLIEQTQRLLFSNVQEALALEVGLLKLRL
jgi:DNA polymerase-3 subunit delta'